MSVIPPRYSLIDTTPAFTLAGRAVTYRQYMALVPIRAMMSDVQRYMGLSRSLSIVLPEDILPGVTELWGLPVQRADGPPGLILRPDLTP